MLKGSNRIWGVLGHGEISRILRFVLVGLLNTAFGYLAFLLAFWLGASPALSVLVANVLGYTFNFLTTGRFVFFKREFSYLPRFVGAAIVVYAVNLGLLKVLLALGSGAEAAQLACLPVVMVLNYLSMRLFVYR